MRFIQYCRKSSEGDERQVQSIPDQESVLAKLASLQDLVIVKKLEEARSAKTPETRPAFAEMLQLIGEGKAEGILCWHLNRLSRNPVDSGRLSWMLQQGIIKCIRTPERDYLPGDNVVIMAVENAVSNQYIIDHSRNIRRAQDEKAARGWYPYRPPTGYRTNRDTHELEIDPERFPLLRRAWELMLSQAYTVPEVLEKLTDWGYRTPRKNRLTGPMARSKLYRVFDDRFYYGEFRHRGVTYTGKHQPMVTREEFERVQRFIHKESHIQPQKHSFAFTGLMRCGSCGCLITAERKTKHYRTTNRTVRYCYYRCTRSKGCRAPAVTENFVESTIGALLDRCRLDAQGAAWAEQALLRDDQSGSEAIGPLIANHQAALTQAKKKLSGLLDLRLGGELTADEFQELKAKYQRQIDMAEGAIDRLNRYGERRQQNVKNLIAYATRAADLFARFGEKVKREVATVLGTGHLLTLGHLELQVHPLLRPLLALERPKDGPHKVQTEPHGAPSPQLCAVVDDIRTLLKDENVAFPKLECLDQVRDLGLETAEVAPTKQVADGRRPAA